MPFFLYAQIKKSKQKKICINHGSPPDKWIKNIGKRVPYAASLTVEASFVVPMFMAAILALVFFLIVINTQIKIQKALFNQTMNMAGYAYFTELVDVNDTAEEITEALLIKAGVINELGESFFEKSFIEGGSRGITLNVLSEKEANTIDVILIYKMRVPFDLLGIGKINLISRAKAHIWSGDDGKENVWNNEMVYMTKSGTVYHLYADCSYLSSQIFSCKDNEIVNKRNEDGEKYKPCKKCCTTQTEGTVFYTKYGNCYHQSATCSSLSSNIYSIEKSKVIDKYPLCSKCMKRSEKGD